MEVAVYLDNMRTIYVDRHPVAGDVITDIPQRVLDRYDQAYAEFIDACNEIENFCREQDRDDQYSGIA